jgi:hypothetical protein
MKLLPILGALVLFTHAGMAWGRCENLVAGLDDASGDRVVSQFKQLVQCDSRMANQEFHRFMKASVEADTLVALSLTAIDANIWNPVWEMIGKISSYDARDEVADRVGQACAVNPKVVGFLKGAYFALRDLEFSQWDDALVTCESPEFQDWLVEQVEKPPPKLYDDKWGALLVSLVRRQGPQSLGHLAKSAVVAAGNGGPLDAILTQMDAAVTPELGMEMSAENRKLLEDTLIGVAREVSPDKAFTVADRLANSGSDARAAEILPFVFPDRKVGGAFYWGGASVEAVTCEGQKQAIVHFATVKDSGKRWIVLTDATAPLRAFKPRLKCKTEEPWLVVVSQEPLKNPAAVSTWVLAIAKQWEAQGFVTKTREEKGVELP